MNEDQILFNMDLEKFSRRLTFQELLISIQLLDGFELQEIAERQSCSPRYISKVVSKLRKKYRNFLVHMDGCK